MPAAVIEVNGVAGSNDNLPINVLVQLSNQDVGGETTYAWTVMDQPEGAADALSNPAIENPTITIKKEGTYRLRLVVNAATASEVIGYATIAVRHLRSFEREPAAGELLETDLVRGWAKAQNRISRHALNGATDGNLLACLNAGVGALALGTIVKIIDQGTIKTGLPGEERLPGCTAVAATVGWHVTGTLGVVVVSPDGTAINAGEVAIVRVLGLSEIAVAGVPAINDPVYVSNAGLPALVAGTYPRVIGRVVQVSGGNYRWMVEGTRYRKGIVPRQFHPSGRTFGASWTPAGGGWLAAGAGGAFVMGLDVERGDKVVGIDFERYGDGAADFTAINAYAYGPAGVTAVMSNTSLVNPAAAWVTTSMPAFVATEMVANMGVFLEFVGNAANLRVGMITMFYIPAGDAKA